MVQRFHLGDLLSVSTGKLLCPDGVDGLYRVLNFLTGDSLFTHQLPAAAETVRPSLVQQFPFLAHIQAPETFSDETAVHDWVAQQAIAYGEWHEVVAPPSSIWGEH